MSKISSRNYLDEIGHLRYYVWALTRFDQNTKCNQCEITVCCAFSFEIQLNLEMLFEHKGTKHRTICGLCVFTIYLSHITSNLI